MKTRLFLSLLVLLGSALVSTGYSANLSESVQTRLLQKAQAVQRAFDTGDADAIIRSTHPSILKFFPSREQFETTTRQAIAASAGQVTTERNDWGVPTSSYVSGDEEVTFLPKTTILRIGDKRARAVGFLIAARKVGTDDWLFLDCASLRKDPSLLWQLFPGLPKDVKLPPNTVELLQ